MSIKRRLTLAFSHSNARTFAGLFILCITLGACSQQPPKPTDTSAPAHLGDYHWTLLTLNERPASTVEARAQVDVSGNRLQVSGLCNNMMGSAEFAGDQLRIGQLASTLKACTDAELMTFEQSFGQWLTGVTHWSLLDAPTGPQLVLYQGNGDFIRLRGVMTAEKRFGSTPDTIFLEIQPKMVPCSHPLIPDYLCLQVRDIHYSEQGLKTAVGDWYHFYDPIENYQHQGGTRVILRLKRYTLANPPADGSGYAYVHDLTVEQELVSP